MLAVSLDANNHLLGTAA